MLSLNQDRITDVSFYIDDELLIYKPNRNFLRLVNIVSKEISLKDIVIKDDIERLIENIKAYQKHFVTKIFVRQRELEVLLAFEYLGDLIKVDMLLLNNLYEDYDNLNVKSKEYETLLTTLDYFYWIFDVANDTIILKNTRELGVIFQGTLNQYLEFSVKYFNINDEDNRVNNSLKYDVENYCCARLYKYATKDENCSITLRTKDFVVHDKKHFIGVYSFDNDDFVLNRVTEKRDGLTGLYNKKTIVDIVKNHIDSNIEFSLAVIDIDRFKHFNDTYGHAYGDKVISTVAGIIKDSVKGIGYAGRIGGDEFLCVIEKIDEESLRNIVRDIRLGVQWALPANTTDAVVTCSIGIARYPLNIKNYEGLFDLADKCLYIAKNKGRNCYVIYKPEMHDTIIKKTEESKQNDVISNEYYNNVKDQYNILQAIENNQSDMLEILAKYLGVDKITIYDEFFNLAKLVGDKTKEPRRNYIKKPDYFKYYNNFGYFLMDNTNILDTLDKEKYDMYLSDNIATSLEVIKKDKFGNVMGVLCFDKYKPAKTFQEDKVKFALFICDLLLK